MTITVTDLYIHPIKAMQSVPVKKIQVSKTGIAGDRQLVLKNTKGTAITARDHPNLLSIVPHWQEDRSLIVTAPNMEDLHIPTPTEGLVQQSVKVWDETATGVDMGDETSSWFSKLIEKECRLVATTSESSRSGMIPDMGNGFRDIAPILLTAEESLQDLSTHLKAPLTHQQFRPNMVVSGLSEPFDEDFWAVVRIGDLIMDIHWTCARCVVTTMNPKTGVQDQADKPFQVMKQHRKGNDGKVYFGNYLFPRSESQIKIGDAVEILERREAMVSEADFEKKLSEVGLV